MQLPFGITDIILDTYICTYSADYPKQIEKQYVPGRGPACAAVPFKHTAGTALLSRLPHDGAADELRIAVVCPTTAQQTTAEGK